MAYTKDVTQSQAYKDVRARNEKGSGSQLLETAKVLKDFAKNKYEEQVSENLKLLQDEKIYEKQKVKNNLAGLNDFYNIEKNITDSFGGDVRAWAFDFESKKLQREALSRHGLQQTEDAKFNVNFPSEAMGGFLDSRTDNLVSRYNDIKTNLQNVKTPYRDLAKADSFVDTAYQKGLEGLAPDLKFNLVKSGRSFFDGQGLGAESPADLRKRFNSNMMKNSDFASIQTLNASIKALYMYDPSLVQIQKDIIKNADIKKDFNTTIGETYDRVIKDRDAKGKLTGKEFTQKVYDIKSTWVDTQGKFQEESRTVVSDNRNTTPATDMTQYQTHLNYLQPEGHEEYSNLIENNGYTPQGAWLKLKNEYGKDTDTLKQEGNLAALRKNADASWKDLQASYFVDTLAENTFGAATKTSSYRKDIQNFLDGAGKKPEDFYRTFDDYLQSFDKTSAIRSGNYSKLNPRYVEETPGSSIVIMKANLSDSPEWKDFIGSEEAVITIKEDMLGIKGLLEDQYTNDYKNNINDNVSKEGNFFINYFSDKDKIKRGLILLPETDPNNPDAKTIKEVTGLDPEAFQNEKVEIGYNFRTNTPVFKKLGLPLPKDPDLNRKKEKEITEKTWLQKTNDVPYIGAVSNFMLGDKLDIIDATWFIPGSGIIKIAGRTTVKAAVTFATNRMLANPTTMKTAEKFMKMRQSTKTVKVKDSKGKVIKIKDSKGNLVDKTTQQNTGQFLGFNNKKAMDAYVKNLSAADQAILAGVSKSGKSFEKAKFVTAFTNLKGIELLGKVSQVTSKLPSIPSIVKLGVPVGAAIWQGNINEGKTTEEKKED